MARNHEANWLSQLQKAGIAATDRASMKSAGFMVCAKDLEQEFVRALGLSSAQAIIATEGEANAFTSFQKQPAHSTATLDEQLCRFLQKEKIRWALPLVGGLSLKAYNALLVLRLMQWHCLSST